MIRHKNKDNVQEKICKIFNCFRRSLYNFF